MRVTVFGRFCFSVLLVVSSLLLVSILAGGQTVPTNQVVASSGIVYRNSVSVSFINAQQAGGTNVVIVGWNDSSSTITSVTDTNGNTYFQAAGTMLPSAPPLDVSQAIYVGSNIKAGANTVTVTFNGFTGAQDVRIVEYGVGTGPPFIENTTFPLDTWVGLTGNTSPAATGTLTTTYPSDVLVVGGTIDSAFTSINKPCGTGCSLFTEIAPGPPFFDIVADADVTALGAYQATAPTSGGGGGNFVMQMVALRVAGQTTIPNPPPTAVSVLPATSGEEGGVSIGITGTGFLPGANVTVTGTLGVNTLTVSAVNCVVASATTINCVTPVFPKNTTNPSLIVTNPDGQAAAPLPFAYTASFPFTTVAGNFSPVAGATDGGTTINITGSEFASGATVTVGGTRADKILVVNSGTIIATVPAGSAGAQTITVTNPSSASGSPGQFTYNTGAGINFVQANSAGSTSAAFTLAQTAGDLNVVVIGWGDATSTITGVSDSAGNTYTAAVNTIGTGLTQAIWYAKNIKASASNTVTVTFNAGPASPDLRILEYSGLDTASPLDGSGVGTSGTGTFLDSGPVTVTGVGDMILGAGTVAGGITPAPNKACADNSCTFATALFTAAGNNVEHTFPTVAGPFDATANQSPSSPWVMQAVAFKQPTGAVAGFTVGATAPAAVSAGGSTTSTITVTPSGGFNSAVALTCTAGLPTGASCAPLSLTPGGSPATGTLTISTLATTPVGTSTVTITGTSGSVVNTTTVSLVVAAAGGGNFTLTATPASQTVTAGASATSMINIVPSGGFTGTVNLTCSITTTASPAPVCSIPATATTTATLTVSTTAATAALRHSTSIYYAALLPLFGMTLLGVSFGSRRKKVLGVLLVFLLVSGLIFLAACGGSSHSGGGGGHPGTPPGNYTVTVTGTSGSLASQTTTFTLTVQ